MKTLYLHMGMPKTGTSSLQCFLSENRSILASYGVCFPDMGLHFKGIGDVRNGHFLTFWNETDSKFFPSGMKKLREISSDYHNIFLSDEGLWRIQHQNGFWEHLLPCMEEAGFQVCPIVYLRRQDLFVESYWNQGIKGRKKQISTFSQYMEKKGYRYVPLHYDEELRRIESFVGEHNLIVRPYESEQLTGNDIRRDLLEAIHVSPVGFDFTKGHNINPGFSNEALEIKRLINTNQLYREIPNFYLASWQQSYESSSDHIRPSFTPEERELFLAEYCDGNAFVARTYLSREDGRLFSEHIPKYKPFSPSETAFESELVRMFSAGDVYLYQQLEALRMECRDLKKQLDCIRANQRQSDAAPKTSYPALKLKRLIRKLYIAKYNRTCSEKTTC